MLDPVPPALRDRMEVLELAGYTEEEKLDIATDHLVDKQVKNHGLTSEYIRFTPDSLRSADLIIPSIEAFDLEALRQLASG